MKKLSYEAGLLVLRNMDGTLFWSSHWVDMKGSHIEEYDDGGYRTILLEGTLTEQSSYSEDKKFEL